MVWLVCSSDLYCFLRWQFKWVQIRAIDKPFCLLSSHTLRSTLYNKAMKITIECTKHILIYILVDDQHRRWRGSGCLACFDGSRSLSRRRHCNSGSRRRRRRRWGTNCCRSISSGRERSARRKRNSESWSQRGIRKLNYKGGVGKEQRVKDKVTLNNYICRQSFYNNKQVMVENWVALPPSGQTPIIYFAAYFFHMLLWQSKYSEFLRIAL